MERKAEKIVDFKQKLIEFSRIKAELSKEVGEEILSRDIPPAEFEEEDFDLEVQGDEVYWSCTDKSTWLITYGATPISYFDKTNKEIKLMLLKEIQDSYRKRDEEIEDDIERLKVRIKELNASRRSKIGKWIKVKHLIEELQ
jgi:hypothetical protein